MTARAQGLNEKAKGDLCWLVFRLLMRCGIYIRYRSILISCEDKVADKHKGGFCTPMVCESCIRAGNED